MDNYNKLLKQIDKERKDFKKNFKQLKQVHEYKSYEEFLKSQREYFRDILETEKEDIRYFQGIIYMINYLINLEETLDNERRGDS